MPTRLKDTLLLVGGEQSVRAELSEIFSSSYNLLEAENAPQAEMLLEQNADCIVLILADIPLGDDDGLSRIITAAGSNENRIPVIAFSDSASAEESAFRLGAEDVISKPFSHLSVQRRVQVIIDLHIQKWTIAKVTAEQSETIRNANQVVMDTLSTIVEHRSTESGNHVLRIRRFTKILLEEVAKNCPEYGLDEITIDTITSASALHDIGKISIPDAILNKPGALTSEEYEIMKTHTTVGSEIVEQLAGMGEEMYLRYAYNISLYHHERWDGKGYPKGLAGNAIPICAQVVGLADAFDALTTPRVYKPAYDYSVAINMILNGECGLFSYQLLECFKNVRDRFVVLAREYADGHSPKSDAIRVALPTPGEASQSRDSLQTIRAKYQAILHYTEDTVLEFDIDAGVYHVVYNPNPEIDIVVAEDGSSKDMFARMRGLHYHPDDSATLDEIERFIRNDLFTGDIRRRSFPLRLYSHISGKYVDYRMTLLRIGNAASERRYFTSVWHKVRGEAASSGENAQAEVGLHTAPALYGLVSTAIRCRCDSVFSVDAGISDLGRLVGRTPQEIADSFGGSFVALIDPRDREGFAAAAAAAMSSNCVFEHEFRMLHGARGSFWALAKGRVHLEPDGREFFYLAIRDNSTAKELTQQLTADIERNSIIIDQTGGIVFDWDMSTDTMYCSPKWAEHFGYDPVSKNYGAQMGIATHFHPAELPRVRELIEKIQSGDESAMSVDVRIANAHGKYLWTKITAASMRGEDGELSRIVGVLQDIDELKRATLVLEERAQLDSLTKLLNKESAQEFAADYLSEMADDELAALLVVDLDNFKAVNDSYGHLYGDVVLTNTANALRRLFRTGDVIGRIGGDEFLIVMKDIPSEEMVTKRCELILETLRPVLSGLAPELNVSCSIGAAIAPMHGTNYAELFENADEALYASKGKGKNCYSIFSSEQVYATALERSSATTRIDSDDPLAVTSESFERVVFRALYSSSNIERTIQKMLGVVGAQFNVSRVYIFENNADNTACSNTFEWCNEGITSEKESLQNVSYIDDIPGWMDVYDENGVFYCENVKTLAPNVRAIVEPQGIKSMLQYAIRDKGVFRGYVGFDECSFNRVWTKEQMQRLEFLSEALAVFLLRYRSDSETNA